MVSRLIGLSPGQTVFGIVGKIGHMENLHPRAREGGVRGPDRERVKHGALGWPSAIAHRRRAG
jgi:hypothetical protein